MKNKFSGYITTPDLEAVRHLLYIRGIGLIRDNPSFSLNRKSFPDYLVMTCLSGKLVIRQYGKTKFLTAGKTCFLTLEDPHAYYSDTLEPCEMLWVHFGGAPAAQLLPLLLSQNNFDIFDCPAAADLILRAGQVRSSDHLNSGLRISGILYQLLMEVLGAVQMLRNKDKPAQDDFLAQIHVYFEEHLGEKITLSQMAEYFHFNEAYFCRKVKKCTGLPPMQYLLQKKIEIAKYQLLYTREKLVDIGNSLGFFDQNHFSYVFHKMTGMSPSAYRKNQQCD